MSNSVTQFQIIEEDYEPLSLLSDLETIEGIASYFKLYSNITGNKKIRVFVDQKKYRPSKKYVLSKDTRKVPNIIESSMKYFVVTRSSKSYNIYTFDNINFLNGVYIGVGLCREDYKYIIRGFGKTVNKVAASDGLLLTPDNKQEYNTAVNNLVEYANAPNTSTATVATETEEAPKVVHKAAATKTKDDTEDEDSGGMYGIQSGTSKQKAYGTDGVNDHKETERQHDDERSEQQNDRANEANDEPIEVAIEIEPLVDLADDYVASSSPKKAKIVRKSPVARRNSGGRRLSPRNTSTTSPVFESMKLDELKRYADKNKINIKGLSKKSEIVTKLNNYK